MAPPDVEAIPLVDAPPVVDGTETPGTDASPGTDATDATPVVDGTETPDATDANPAPGATPPANPAREWAVVGGQLVGALVGGAALWFGFRWLWEWQSVVALVLSAVVIVGLVVVVRVLRRAEDLFSTVLAVLAGLIVTVSPPVLTLTGS